MAALKFLDDGERENAEGVEREAKADAHHKAQPHNQHPGAARIGTGVGIGIGIGRACHHLATCMKQLWRKRAAREECAKAGKMPLRQTDELWTGIRSKM